MKKKINIVFIIGTRPQYIKLSPILRKINEKKYNKYFNFKIIDTGQHYDKNMSDNFYRELQLKKANINLKVGSNKSNIQTAKILIALEGKINLKNNIDYVIVFGDTNSTLAGSIFSIKNSIKLIHIESGLRSYEEFMPEEINRVITDKISTVLFCPTKNAVINLKKEGIRNNVINSGDLMYDNFLFFKEKFIKTKLSKFKYILVTIHRAENTDNVDYLINFINVLNELSKSYQIIFPIHPRTKKILITNKIKTDNIQILQPQSYLNILKLLINSKVLVTDSGGLQKEAFFAKKPCVTIRKKTEWNETLQGGWNRLANINNHLDILNKIKQAVNFKKKKSPNPFFGNGQSASVILDYIIKIT
jgi:UDP-GlcNAc3NAcA epimerase